MNSNPEQLPLVSVFEGFSKPVADKKLLDILFEIHDGLYKDQVEKVREALSLGNKSQAGRLKKQLPAFTPSALFDGGRKMEYLLSYSGFLILDLDHLDEVESVFARIVSSPYAFSCFRSPGGKGLKVVVEITSSSDHHELAFDQVATYFEKLLHLAIDRSGKDVTRLCFVSYDPSLFINTRHEKFLVDVRLNVSDSVDLDFSYAASLDSEESTFQSSSSLPSLSSSTSTAPSLANEDSPFRADQQRPTLSNVNAVGQGTTTPKTKTISNKKTTTNFDQSLDRRFQHCVNLVNKKMIYQEGNRNNYIHLLACYTNRTGIALQDALPLINSSFDLDRGEINTIVVGVYKRNVHQAGQYHFKEKVEPGKRLQQRDGSDSLADDFVRPSEDLLTMPSLPEAVYNSLPELLAKGSAVFFSNRERDIFLTGAITILSGCIPNVEGIYDQRTVYPNLNCFIISPAASGKSALVLAKALGQGYHHRLLKESREALLRYQGELQLYKASLQHRKKGEAYSEEEPQRPRFKVLFIPGNSSSAAVIRHLMDADEKGIFCETEADTMGYSLKQDWGGYSDLLRKAFQHEIISYSRKTNQEFLEIHKPRLSVALSGTPAQVSGLIRSAEDGLFSRFIFYTFKVLPEWRDVSPHQDRPNLTQHFEMLSNKVLAMVDFLERYPSSFDLTPTQWVHHNQKCSRWLKEMHVFVSEEATSSVKRLGLIVFRMAMVLTALRKFENGDTTQYLTCDDTDFEISFSLAEVYRQHAVYMFQKLPRTEKISDLRLKKFYDALPVEFQRKQAVEIGKTIPIEERSADRHLSLLLKEGFLIKSDYGHYFKK